MKMKDLAMDTADSTSALAAFKLLWDRFMYTGTARHARKDYEWIFGFYFLLLEY
jgi:hypothetical protein